MFFFLPTICEGKQCFMQCSKFVQENNVSLALSYLYLQFARENNVSLALSYLCSQFARENNVSLTLE